MAEFDDTTAGTDQFVADTPRASEYSLNSSPSFVPLNPDTTSATESSEDDESSEEEAQTERRTPLWKRGVALIGRLRRKTKEDDEAEDEEEDSAEEEAARSRRFRWLPPGGRRTRIGLAVGISVVLLVGGLLSPLMKHKPTIETVSDLKGTDEEKDKDAATAAPDQAPAPERSRQQPVVAAISPRRGNSAQRPGPQGNGDLLDLPQDNDHVPLVQNSYEGPALPDSSPTLRDTRQPIQLASTRTTNEEAPVELPDLTFITTRQGGKPTDQPPPLEEPVPLPVAEAPPIEGPPPLAESTPAPTTTRQSVPRPEPAREPFPSRAPQPLSEMPPGRAPEPVHEAPPTRIQEPVPYDDRPPRGQVQGVPDLAPAPSTYPAQPAEPTPTPDDAGLVAIPNARSRHGTTRPASVASVTSTPSAVDHSAADSTEPILHTVRGGENFYTIAEYYYGSGRYWKALWAVNSQVCPSPTKLAVGMTIKIPMPEALDAAMVEPARAPAATAPAPSTTRRATNESEATEDRSIIRSTPRSGRPTTVGQSKAITPSSLDQDTDNGPSRRVGLPVHTVQRSNETLRSIARDRLGDVSRAEEIHDLNYERLGDNPVLKPGMALRLPEDARERR
jgi:nucleoid-associated protein YgaU